MKLFTVPVLKLDYQTIFINRNHIITLQKVKEIPMREHVNLFGFVLVIVLF